MNKFINNNFYLSKDLQDRILSNINSRSTNSIILAGPKGLGKYNFILQLAKYLLCKSETEEDKLNINFNFNNIIKNKSFHL